MVNNIINDEVKNKIDKKKILKKAVISAFIFIITVLVGLILFYKYTLYQAEKNFSMDKYPEAKQFYQTALKFSLGLDWDIVNKIKSCDDLQSSLNEFNRGTEALNNKSYFSAMTAFKKVSPKDQKRFDLAKDKIVESQNLYIEATLDQAQKYNSEENYDLAIRGVQNALNLDPSNERAKELLAEYKADEAARRKAGSERAEAEAKARNEKYKAEVAARKKAEQERAEANLKAYLESKGIPYYPIK